jgi:hypothetical protein
MGLLKILTMKRTMKSVRMTATPMRRMKKKRMRTMARRPKTRTATFQVNLLMRMRMKLPVRKILDGSKT